MATALDILNAKNEVLVNLEDLKLVHKNKNGTFNFVTKINDEDEYINFVTLDDLKKEENGKLLLTYGKKDPKWQKEYWYVK